jgi:hypothetical protein
MPLAEVCAVLQLEVPTVLPALSERASISTRVLGIALRMRENGNSLESISELCEVPLESLLEIWSDQPAEAAIRVQPQETNTKPN